MQMTHMLLHQGGVAKIMTDVQICATYFAALVHDFEHLGVNNDYLIKTSHRLAVMYNDISPLENHHLAAAIRVMMRPDCQFNKVRRTDRLSVAECVAFYEADRCLVLCLERVQPCSAAAKL